MSSAVKDIARQGLERGGRIGQKILQARERVLEILQSENACTEWYRSREANPAAVFQSLTFALDRKGQEYIVERRDLGSLAVFYNPYVAKVIQNNGADSTITLNANGAFFFPSALVTNGSGEGGPINFRAPRLLHVGPYTGDTFRAQVLTLLHEFGHLLDLLPVDEGDRDGKSLQNSLEVLRHCRTEVELRARASSRNLR